MRGLYEKVRKELNNIDFNEIWSGFNRCKFALYNDKQVYLEDRVIPWDNRFLGNTAIDFEGEKVAIWKVNNEEKENSSELAANVAHEMFHVHQYRNNELRFPNDIKGLSYPSELENYKMRCNEIAWLIQGIETSNKNNKLQLLKQTIASRKLREQKFGELIKYEANIETVEASAEYCGFMVLKILDKELYTKRIEWCKDMLRNEGMLFDIRRSCYFTGTLIVLLLDELNIRFNKSIKNQTRTMFEELTDIINTDDIEVSNVFEKDVETRLKMYIERKEKQFNEFFSKEVMFTKGKYIICGFDPMNMIKQSNQILCKHFIMLKEKDRGEKVFVKGPVVIDIEEETQNVLSYHTLM